MSLISTLGISISAKDKAAAVDVSNSKNVSLNVADLQVIESTYSLEAAQATYQEISKGDIATIRQVYVGITCRPTTFSGLGVAFDSTVPTDAQFIITNSFAATVCEATNNLYLKNLDTCSAVQLTVVLVGTNG